MRKALACLTIAAFAAVASVQASDQCTTAKSGCCADQAKTTSACTATKTTAKTSDTKSCCSSTAKVVKRNSDVKGATLLVQR